MFSRYAALACLVALALAACVADHPATEAPAVAVTVAPLSLPGVTNATYMLEIANKSGDVLISRTLDSRAYGAGDGSISFVGPCDASPGENPNQVTLTLTGLFTGSGGATPMAADTWQNPGPLSRSVNCAENGDTTVAFDLTILRRADQGFFDVAVSFEDIFCAAKLDCVDNVGAPLALLYDGGQRARTVVVGLACAGRGDTTLYRDPITVTCAAGSAVVDPSLGPGNLAEGAGIASTGAKPPLFGAAVYRGAESGGERYWNVALGLAADAADCVVTTQATASTEPFTGGATPANTTWPFITWDVQVTAPTTAALDCTHHPVNGAAPNDGVATRYAGPDAPEPFAYAFGPQTDAPALCAAGQEDCALASCRAIYDAGLSMTNGPYAIDPDGPGEGAAAFDTYCLMETAPGGWTLVARVYGDAVDRFPFGGWPTLTAFGDPGADWLRTGGDMVTPAYTTVTGDAILFYGALAPCGVDHRLMESASDLLAGRTLPAWLASVPVYAGCGGGHCNGAATTASNTFIPTFLNSGCVQPFHPDVLSDRLPDGRVGVNLAANNSPTEGVTFAVQGPAYDTGVGGVPGPNSWTSVGDVDSRVDGVDRWHGNVLTIFVR